MTMHAHAHKANPPPASACVPSPALRARAAPRVHASPQAPIQRKPSISTPAVAPDHALVERELAALATQVDRALLDALEAEDGYLVWALRLGAHVDPTAARERARTCCDSGSARLRYWARRIVGANEAQEP
jgi:hypothetical protein